MELAIKPHDLVAMISVEESGEVTFGGTALAQLDTEDRLALRAQALLIASNLHAFSRALENEIAVDMAADGASEFFHPDYVITFAPPKGSPVVYAEPLYNRLTALAAAGKADPAQVAKAVQRIESVEYKANRTYLKPLEKLGGDVAKAINDNVIPPLPLPPVLSIKVKRKGQYGKLDEWTSPVMVNGGGNCSIAAARDAMGIDWMTKGEINEAIPPAYTEWIGAHQMRSLAVAA